MDEKAKDDGGLAMGLENQADMAKDRDEDKAWHRKRFFLEQLSGVHGGSLVPAGFKVIVFRYLIGTVGGGAMLTQGSEDEQPTEIAKAGSVFILTFKDGRRVVISGVLAWEMGVAPMFPETDEVAAARQKG